MSKPHKKMLSIAGKHLVRFIDWMAAPNPAMTPDAWMFTVHP